MYIHSIIIKPSQNAQYILSLLAQNELIPNRDIIESCDIFDNEFSGVEVKEDSRVEISNCRINKNDFAVWVNDGCYGLIQNSDLRNNINGSYRFEEGSDIKIIKNLD